MTACLLTKTAIHTEGYEAMCPKAHTFLMATIKNACDTSKIRCRICPENGSRQDCREWLLSPDESMGGWATDLNWCDKGSSIRYACTVGVPEAHSCPLRQ